MRANPATPLAGTPVVPPPAAEPRVELTTEQRRLVLASQRDFPLTDQPYATLAARLDRSEGAVLADFAALAAAGVLARIGATYRTGRAGASTLAALAVPPARLDEVAEIVNGFPEVNHNYEREHRYNLWFVVTAADGPRLAGVIAGIEAATGLAVLVLPMERAYRIDLGFAP